MRIVLVAWLALAACGRERERELGDAGAAGDADLDAGALPPVDPPDAWLRNECGFPFDVCAAETLAVGETRRDDTSRWPSQLSPACSTSRCQREAVYAIDHEAGLLTVTVESTFDAILELRSECEVPNDTLCTDTGLSQEREVVAACVEPGRTLAVVDGYGDADLQPVAAGAFSVTAGLEVCREDETCRPDLAACARDLDAGDTCDDAVPLELDRTVLSSAAVLTDDADESGCDDPRPDGTFAVEIPAVGELSVRAWDPGFRDLPSVSIQNACGAACGTPATAHDCLDPGPAFVGFQAERDLAIRTHFSPCADDETCQRGFCLPELTAEQEPNDVVSSADEVTDGAWIEAALWPSTEVDWYEIRLEPGQTVTASTVRACEADTVLRVFDDAALAELAPSDCASDDPDCSDDADGTLCGRVSATRQSAGRVWIRVSRHELEQNAQTPGRYVLQVEVDGP